MKNQNQPAFPSPIAKDHLGNIISAFEHHPDYGGMTMRQYYKSAALTGLLASISEKDTAHFEALNLSNEYRCKMFSIHAGQVADAMLAEDEAFSAKPTAGGKDQQPDQYNPS